MRRNNKIFTQYRLKPETTKSKEKNGSDCENASNLSRVVESHEKYRFLTNMEMDFDCVDEMLSQYSVPKTIKTRGCSSGVVTCLKNKYLQQSTEDTKRVYMILPGRFAHLQKLPAVDKAIITTGTQQ